jgi:hypothetical protein
MNDNSRNSFTELLQQVRSNMKQQLFMGRLLAIDPGETVGWALFQAGQLTAHGQITGSGEEVMVATANLIYKTSPEVVVCEAYRIYSWKKDQHTWSDLFTPRLIGVIEYMCAAHEPSIPLFFQMAGTAKGFCTDAKLKQWGYYKPGLKHARDAIRHGCYWLLFHTPIDVKVEQGAGRQSNR